MKSNLGVAARTLALDLATGEVIRALTESGIDCMLLKGPAMTHRLYREAPSGRNYGDIDLLVAPWQFDAAGRVLASLGFEDQLAGVRASEAARLNERPWHRAGAAYLVVDLHRGFHHVANRAAWWDLLCRHREVLMVEGQPVAIPDRVGCALIAGLHASKATSQEKALEDLRRALQLFEDDVWRQAAELARSVGAGNAFAAALHRQNAGADLAARLGLRVTDPAIWFGATSLERGTGLLSCVLGQDDRVGRARRLRDAAFPSRPFLTGSRPIAGRGAGGLAVAHLGRLCFVLTRLPRLLLAWYRTSRTLRRHGGAPPRVRLAARTAHPLRSRAEAAAGTIGWTLRTWWLVHRRLARGPWGNGALPVAAPPLPHSERAARLILTCCRATCLEIALVRQARAAGGAADVIVGVTAPARGFRAHAWLDGDRVDPAFAELWRFPAVAAESTSLAPPPAGQAGAH
jgi:Uncharacterised nucleotidyltransferase/Transglutaminase-like superfamily